MVNAKSLEAVHTHTHTHTDSLENKKGITLVALVVTIVVLLILAGVSINLVLGENGLITKAQEAKQKSHEESIKEQADMALANYQLEKAKNGETSSLEDKKIENLEIIEENDNFSAFTNNNGMFSITTSKRFGFTCSDFIKVDNTKKYYQSVIAKSNNTITPNYIGVIVLLCR